MSSLSMLDCCFRGYLIPFLGSFVTQQVSIVFFSNNRMWTRAKFWNDLARGSEKAIPNVWSHFKT